MQEKEFTLPPATENETREAIAQMSGFKTFEEIGKATPDQTALPGMESTPTGEPEKKKRGRKPGSKNKVSNAPMETDPLLSDKRYKDAVDRMAAFGGSKVIESAFKVTGEPLDIEEKQRVDDLTYVASKRYNLDPSQSPILMAIYTIVLLSQLILVRVAGTTSGQMWEQFRGIFGKKEDEEEKEK